MKSAKDTMARRSRKKGLPPGSLVHVGSRFSGQEGLNCHSYNTDTWKKYPEMIVKAPQEKLKEPLTIWLEINGLSHNTSLQAVFDRLHVNPLILEDILNTDQNAKADIGEGWIFFVLKNIKWNSEKLNWTTEQISLILEPEIVASFAEKKSDLFDPVYNLLNGKESKIRTRGADYTFYTLLDIIVDEYLEICENLELQIEDLELSMEGKPEYDPTPTIHQIRKFQIFFRHQIMPIHEGLTKLIKEPGHLISSDDVPYYQDLLDHIGQILIKLEQIRDNLVSIRELYLTQLNIGMNKVIQLLTVVSTIFIPITFIVGIYGMNFRYMPELQWKYGYFILLGLLAMIGLSTYLFFRRKKWM